MNIAEIRNQAASKSLAVFLVNNFTTWDALHGVYECMKESVDFFPVIVTVRAPGLENPNPSFDKIGVPYTAFDNPREGLTFLKALHPAVLFRQAPWEDDNNLPGEYRTNELSSFTRLVYTEYTKQWFQDLGEKLGVTVTVQDESELGIPFHTCAEYRFAVSFNTKGV